MTKAGQGVLRRCERKARVSPERQGGRSGPEEKQRHAQTALFYSRPVSFKVFFGAHTCLDVANRHSWGWLELRNSVLMNPTQPNMDNFSFNVKRM